MRLLLYLAQRSGEVVSIDELLGHVWAGVVVTPDSVYQAIASLRRLLGDDSKQSRYIATVPRLGYRMIAEVTHHAERMPPPVSPTLQVAMKPASPGIADLDTPTVNHRRGRIVVAVACSVLLMLTVAYWAKERRRSDVRTTIAVLPFLDLTTQEMNEEFFADGLTEELIGDLSKIATLRVPPPTAVFYYKGKQLPVADIARQLGVTFVIDGSVRKSGNTYRVAMRLIRADTGYVEWSETYDRPLGDLVEVQKDVAVATTEAVLSSIDGTASIREPVPGGTTP